MLDMSEEAGGARRSALSPTYPTGAARARAQGLYHSEEGGEAGVTEVAAHQLYTAPGWAEPVWRNVVPHFHVMAPRELARFNAAGARARPPAPHAHARGPRHAARPRPPPTPAPTAHGRSDQTRVSKG